MHNIFESIEIIGDIIDGLSIDGEKLAEFREQYDKIKQRSIDPNFYLSTIGDFSSGKSTLINTIMRRKLLKVAHAATTAVPTYIYRGKRKQVVIRVKCDDGVEYDLTSEYDVIEFEKRFNVTLPVESDDRISLLTTDKELSLKINEVNIELPEDELVGDLCIIDTPGINPGADFAEKHEEITKQILNEKADAIIILFPADQAYTQSFEKFLKDNAQYFMKDAIFVVTMMDRVDEEEQNDVIQFVKTNLRNNFHLQNPQVLFCSAMLFGKDLFWTNHFIEFEKNLLDKLTKNRQRIIIERLRKLSNELLSSIQNEIIRQKDKFEKRLSILQKHSVPILESVLTENQRLSISELSEIQSEHNKAVICESEYLGNKIMQNVNNGLYACDTRSGVSKYVNGQLISDIESACQEMYLTSTRYTASLDSVLASTISNMIEKLKVYYGEIGSVLSTEESLPTSEQQITIADKIAELSGMIGDHEGKIDVATVLGGAGLAAIILTGLGPIGWIIGGVVALVGGDRLFVDSARVKVRRAMIEKIPDISTSVTQGLVNGMQVNYDKAQEILLEKKNELIFQYKPTYEKLVDQFNLEKRSLADQIKDSEIIQNRIREVLLQINQIEGGSN